MIASYHKVRTSTHSYFTTCFIVWITPSVFYFIDYTKPHSKLFWVTYLICNSYITSSLFWAVCMLLLYFLLPVPLSPNSLLRLMPLSSCQGSRCTYALWPLLSTVIQLLSKSCHIHFVTFLRNSPFFDRQYHQDTNTLFCYLVAVGCKGTSK